MEGGREKGSREGRKYYERRKGGKGEQRKGKEWKKYMGGKEKIRTVGGE